MEDQVLDELEFHQDTVMTDANSPLHLIREKEMEITGRVLTAKREAEEIVAAARKKAVETVRKADEESDRLASEHEETVKAEVVSEIESIGKEADVDIVSLKGEVAERIDTAAKFVVETVTSV